MENLSVKSPDLQEVKAEFQAWRSQTTGRKIIPQYLWDKAFGLLKTYPLTVVRRELGLNRQRLLTHLQSTQPNLNLQSSANCQPTFLQINPSELNIAASTNPNPNPNPTLEAKILPQCEQTCRIVFERSDGSRLSLQLSTNFSTIEAICHTFLKG